MIVINRSWGEREKLPNERQGLTHAFVLTALGPDGKLMEVKGYIQTGHYSDGRLGEFFVKVGKPGAATALLDQWATVCSMALQSGASIDDLMEKSLYTRFEPSGATQNADIPRCTSLTDYVAKWLLMKYGKKPIPAPPASLEETGDPQAHTA